MNNADSSKALALKSGGTRRGSRSRDLTSATELYTELLIRTIANTIYRDDPIWPIPVSPYDSHVRENGLDWPSLAHSMVGVKRLMELRDLTQGCLDRGVPGDFIETGVWRGGCCILMRGVLAANGVRNRKVYVADSFAGLPKPKEDQFPADSGDLHFSYPPLVVSLKQVRENFSRYGLLDRQVVFVRGFFEQTLPALDAGPFALIRLDGDMYESTMLALEHLYPKLSTGGIIMVDDYGAIEGCRRAIDDYRRRRRIRTAMVEVDWTGVWWQKP